MYKEGLAGGGQIENPEDGEEKTVVTKSGQKITYKKTKEGVVYKGLFPSDSLEEKDEELQGDFRVKAPSPKNERLAKRQALEEKAASVVAALRKKFGSNKNEKTR